MTETQAQIDLISMKELSRSRGWQIIKDNIQADIVAAAMSFADSALMSEKEIDFRRGAIFAARSLLTIDSALIARLEGELLLASANADANNPNATA